MREPGSEAAESGGTPLVSVIIPTWNRAAMLGLTLQTVLAQDGRDFEVLVIGDGCTDETADVVASLGDARIRWRNLAENSGAPSVPNNVGLGMARGRFIAHLGHDDFWLPWHLSGLLGAIETTGADWVYSLVVAIGPDGIRHCSGPPRAGVPNAEHHVPPSGWLYRREMATLAGAWADPAALAWPIDFDYKRRAALAGARFACWTRPTALKFPSSLFPDGYRSGEPAPVQRRFFERIRADPGGLELEMLRELAARFAQLDRGGGKGVFARDGSRLDPVDGGPVDLASEESREAFQERRLGRLHLRGLAAEDARDAPADATAEDVWRRPEGGARDQFALRQARRERREGRRQRGAQVRAKRGARDSPAEQDAS